MAMEWMNNGICVSNLQLIKTEQLTLGKLQYSIPNKAQLFKNHTIRPTIHYANSLVKTNPCLTERRKKKLIYQTLRINGQKLF